MSRHPPLENLQHMALKVKDGIRELRYSARQSAHQALNALMGPQQSPANQFLPPLNLAAQKAWQVLEEIDDAAESLLSRSGEYRRMNYTLLSFSVSPGLRNASASVFQRHFYWTLRHLLVLQNMPFVTVSEEALFKAWQASRKEEATVPGDASAHSMGDQALACARLLLVLLHCQPLQMRLTGPDGEMARTEDERDLLTCTMAACVLAGEISAACPRTNLQENVATALETSLALAQGHLPVWQAALNSNAPQGALAREFAFILRHV